MISDTKKVFLIFMFFSLILLTLPFTWAVFSKSDIGHVSSEINSNSIKFLYSEKSNGLNLESAFPLTDEQGKNQDNYFEFEVKSTTSNNIEIPYDISLSKTSNSSNIDDAVKLYLTEVVPENDLKYYVTSFQRDISLEVCQDLYNEYYPEHAFKASCNKAYSIGDILDHNVYGLKINISKPMNLDSCNKIVQENPKENLICEKKGSSYYVYRYEHYLNDLNTCNNVITEYSSIDDPSCVLIYESGYTFDHDAYDFEVTHNFISTFEEKNKHDHGAYLFDEVGTVNGEKELALASLDKLNSNILFSDVIKANSDVVKKYRLRMWIDSDTDFTDSKYQDAIMGLKVNVSSNAIVK